MVTIWLMALGTVTAISLFSVLLAAAALTIPKDKLNSLLFIMVSFAVGALLGDVFIHILPEAFDQSDAKQVSLVKPNAWTRWRSPFHSFLVVVIGTLSILLAGLLAGKVFHALRAQ